MTEVNPAEGQETLQDRVRRHFHTMKGLDELAAGIPAGPARAALPALLSGKFGVPGHGDDDASLTRLFTFCRLKLDTYPAADGMRAIFVDAVCAALQPGVVVEAAAVDIPGEDGLKAGPAERRPPSAATQPPAGDAGRETVQVRAPAPRPDRPAVSVAKAHHAEASAEDRVLFPGQPFTGDLPVHYPSLLLPCPDQGRVQSTRSRWLSGEVWSRDAVAIGFGELSHRAEERLADAEAEFAADPAAYGQRNGITMISGEVVHSKARAWLEEAAERTGQGAPGPAEVTRAMRDAFARAIVLYAPDHATTLAGLGAHVEAGAGARDSIACALRLEHALLEGWTDGEGRRAQILLGAPHPERAIGPGTAMTRAAVIHLITGRQIADCLVEGLAELRLAQVLRDVPDHDSTAILSGFDRIFFTDCQAPLDDYRFAKNEMEMAM